MNYIKKAVGKFQEQHPDKKLQEIAAEMLPDKTEKRAREILSRWMNGHELDTIRIGQIVQISDYLGITPNELLQWEK